MTGPVRRVAVVTGGAGAIGGSVAAALTAADHQVVIMDRTGDVPVDLADEGQVRVAAQRVLDQAGRCDVLVHAAAAFDRADLGRLDLAVWRRVQAVNVESALLLAQAFVPGMAARGFGRIIFVVSDTVWAPPAADLLPYVSSKGALVALGRALAVAHGPDGIAVTCVAPGLTDTSAARRRDARRRVRIGPGPPGAAARPAARRRGGDRGVPRLGWRGRAYRPGPVHRRRPGHALARLLSSYQPARASVLAIVRSTRSGSRRGGRWSIPGTTVSSQPGIRAAASRLDWISGG